MAIRAIVGRRSNASTNDANIGWLRCPHCQGPLKRCRNVRMRYIEDIPEGISPGVTEHTIHRDWRPACKKLVEPKVTDALPDATFQSSMFVYTLDYLAEG
jgi:hypothetical protein